MYNRYAYSRAIDNTVAEFKRQMQPTYRTCIVDSVVDLRAIWAPGVSLHQPVKLVLGALNLSAECITILEQQASNIATLFLRYDFVVPKNLRRELVKTLLLLPNCKQIELRRCYAVNLG